MSNTFPAKFVEQWPYPLDYGYDEECYPNFYSLSAKHVATDTLYVFEISSWRDDTDNLISWIYWLHVNKCRMLGFNNIGYDYLLLHFIFMNCKYWTTLTGEQRAYEIYKFSAASFKQPNESEDDYRRRKWKMQIREHEQLVAQLDLYKIYHFDGTARHTSLKVLQINMRRDNVQELPVKPGTVLTYDQRCEILTYNIKDVDDTLHFAKFSLDEIKLREMLTVKFNYPMLNLNEAKIGEEMLRILLTNAGINTRGKTPKEAIVVKEILFPYIRFNRPEFNQLLDFFNDQVIVNTKKSDDDDSKYPCAVIDGFPWQFGRGGMHGSIESTIIKEDDYFEITDVDVVSFYPKLGIVNNVYMRHLGAGFCPAYDSIFDMRGEYPKDVYPMENNAFKIALNSGYGKSNSEYSFLFDPKYTMTITINGQLLLCMLGEWLMSVPELTMIQANTDGITFKAPKRCRDQIKSICQSWEQYTLLKLEFNYYSAMYIRDVNNYIATYSHNGEIKSKGAYVHKKIPWHKNHSAVIIARAAEEYLVNGVDVFATIMACKDPFDFMIKAKVPRGSELWLSHDDNKTQLQNTTRYYVACYGGKLDKVMPPTDAMREAWRNGTHYIRQRDGDYKVVKPDGKRPAKTYDEVPGHLIAAEPQDRVICLESNWLVADCANVANFNWSNLNYNYYIKEAMKLVDPLMKR